MSYKENLTRAVELKKELDAHRPLSKDMEQRIMQKFRLDWNYHSSNIEGNKLTYGETKALLLFGVTAQAKPLHDHLEMQGHNEAIMWLEEIIQQERPLTENFIRELHKLILKEPYEVDAQTADGKPTKKSIKIGQYKTTPNHVKTKTGEMFYFASPEETPAKMADLMDWYKEESVKEDVNPILLAIEFHYRFIRIHPFDDGNGRLARLLMNFVLMQFGYPPAVVKTHDKENYYTALQQADAGNLDFFFDYISALVLHSLELMIKGANGENIDDDDDLDKKLALLKQEINAENDDKTIRFRLNETVFWEIMYEWGDFLIIKLAKTTAMFNEFYNNPEHKAIYTVGNKNNSVTFHDSLKLKNLDNILPREQNNEVLNSAKVTLEANFGPYIKVGIQAFRCNYQVQIVFEEYHFKIILPKFIDPDTGHDKEEIHKLLHQPLSNAEIDQINKLWGETLFNHLQALRAKLKNNTNKK